MPDRGVGKRIDHMRQTAEFLLGDICEIVAYEREWDAAGGWSESYKPIAVYRCRLDPTIYYRVEQAFGKENIVTNYLLSLPYDAEVELDQRILINGRYYDIVRMHDNHTDRLVKRVLVSEVVYEPNAV